MRVETLLQPGTRRRARAASTLTPTLSLPGRGRSRQRGAIFITALGIIVILSGLVLVFARDMRTEAVTSANRLAYVQADAVEQGAERWVLAQIEANPGDATTITEEPAEAVQIGNGYFWILRANPDNDTQYDFGITDEAGKYNINQADSDELLMFPGMTEEAAIAIEAWRGERQAASYDMIYASLPDPYVNKNDRYESVEELSLVDGVTPELVYGMDRNRDGVVDDAERAASNAGSVFGGGLSAERGLIHYLTAYTLQTPPGMNLNQDANGGTRTSLRAVLEGAGIAQQRATRIVDTWSALRSGRDRRNFGGLRDARTRLDLQDDEVRRLLGKITTRNGVRRDMVNVNTASQEVLLARGEGDLDESDVDKLISARDGADTTSLAWVVDAIGVNKALQIGGWVTSTSSQYSADIVAVSGDGRGFKRVRIVVDAQDQTSPAKIVYRKDLTSLGWPLPEQVRTSLRSGQGVVTGYARTVGTSGRINF